MLQLISIDKARSVFINLYELFPEVLDTILVCHLNKHVHGCLLELTDAPERRQTLKNVLVEFGSSLGCLTHF